MATKAKAAKPKVAAKKAAKPKVAAKKATAKKGKK
jgi:hypothetical protein